MRTSCDNVIDFAAFKARREAGKVEATAKSVGWDKYFVRWMLNHPDFDVHSAVDMRRLYVEAGCPKVDGFGKILRGRALREDQALG